MNSRNFPSFKEMINEPHQGLRIYNKTLSMQSLCAVITIVLSTAISRHVGNCVYGSPVHLHVRSIITEFLDIFITAPNQFTDIGPSLGFMSEQNISQCAT